MKELVRQHQHLLFLCMLSLFLVILHMGSLVDQNVPFDARVTYLPLAQEFIERGTEVFTNPESVHVAPGSYLYMVLAGADPARVKILNLVLAIASAFMVYDVVAGTAGRLAAYIAAMLYAANPMLQSVLIEPLSEPPFIFFTLVWLWGLVRACRATRSTRATAWMLLSIAGLSCSILTRGILFYWIYAAIAACVLFIIFSRSRETKQQAIKILLIHAISLVPVWAYIGHNTSQHDVSMIATGSGAALYFGNNPATYGYEPPYFGLYHDEWLVIEPGSHLTSENDRRLKFAAAELIREQSVGPFMAMTLNKFFANLFFSRTGLDSQIYQYRAIRVTLVFFAGCALLCASRTLLSVMLLGLLGYSAVILSPIMYNARYSIGAVDLPLLLVAAIGVAGLLSKPRRVRLGILLAGVACLAIGLLHARVSQPLYLDMDNPLLRIRQFVTAQPEQVVTQGVTFVGISSVEESVGNTKRQITWHVPPFVSQGGSTIFTAAFQQLDASCRNLKLSFNGVVMRRKHMPVGAPARLDLGVALMGLGTEGGLLTMEFKCDAHAPAVLESLAISAIQYGFAYRERYETYIDNQFDAPAVSR